MKQKVEVKILFSNTSPGLRLMSVYQNGNTLIAVSAVEYTDRMPGEAMCMRSDSVWAEINSDKELAVKHYIINQGGLRLELKKNYSEVKSVEKIREIIGLDPLAIDRPVSVVGQGLFAGSDGDEPEFELEKNQFRPI